MCWGFKAGEEKRELMGGRVEGKRKGPGCMLCKPHGELQYCVTGSLDVRSLYRVSGGGLNQECNRT